MAEAGGSTESDTLGEHLIECACKQVALRVAGNPITQGWCHCSECQLYTQQDVFPFLVYKAAHVSVVRGQDLIQHFCVRLPACQRGFCQVPAAFMACGLLGLLCCQKCDSLLDLQPQNCCSLTFAQNCRGSSAIALWSSGLYRSSGGVRDCRAHNYVYAAPLSVASGCLPHWPPIEAAGKA